jgi:hypothetical protein
MNSTRSKVRSRNRRRRRSCPEVVAAYGRYLDRLSRAFSRRAARLGEKIACRPGCFGCCVGLFEITPLDAAIVARGLRELRPALRRSIASRARRICGEIAAIFPGNIKRGTLDPAREQDWDEFFEKTSAVACPFLVPVSATGGKPARRGDAQRAAQREAWPQGFTCAIYDNRPHTCRTFGLPLTDEGEIVAPACELNLRDASVSLLNSVALDATDPTDLALAERAERQLKLPRDGTTILPAVASGLSAWGPEARRLSARKGVPSRKNPERTPLPRSSEREQKDRPARGRPRGSRSAPRPAPCREPSR